MTSDYSHFGDLQMSKKRYLPLKKHISLLSSDVWGAHAIVSSFNGEQLKKCDSLYISKGIREFSCGVFIAHDLGDPEERKIHLNDSLRVTRCNIFVNSFCCMELKSDNKPILLELCLF